MKDIIRKFFRAHMLVPVRFAAVWAICAAVLFFTGTFSRESTRIPAIVVCAFLGFVTLWSAADIITAPRRFKRRLEGLSEEARGEIISGFTSVPNIGRRWFYEHYLLFFARRRIELVGYDELYSADMRGNRLFLKLIGERELPLPFDASENPAMLVAALRSRNGKMKASIDGKPVDFDKRKKGKEDM